MHTYKVPTLEECEFIVKNNNTFKKKEEMINGVKVIQFSYLLAKSGDFIEPVPGHDMNGIWLRGITFVQNPETDGYNRFLMLPKFFNLNQVEQNLYHNIKHKKVKSVQRKDDGSMISFVNVSGVIMPKTKFSFFNDQTRMAAEVYESDEELREFVKVSLDYGLNPIFELVSPQNRIVLPYSKTELKLLQVVDSLGNLVDADNLGNMYNREKVTESFDYTLDELISLSETVQGEEGWVVRFEDNSIVKIKTAWYFSEHALMTGDINVEHKIIQMTLDESIDDAISKIPEDAVELRNFVTSISDGISKYIDNRITDILDIYEFITYDNPDLIDNRKEYVQFITTNYSENFKELIYAYNTKGDLESMEKFIIQETLKKTNALEKARKFLVDIGVNTSYKRVVED